jgi:hypothetical protein
MSRKSEPSDEAQIRKVVDDWADALSRKDADGVLSHYAPSLVHFSLAPPCQPGEMRHHSRRGPNHPGQRNRAQYESRGLRVCVPHRVKFVSG